jgi:co-chaperonin GroES (HSP10)
MMSIIPFGDRLIVEIFDIKYDGNLELPEAAKDMPQIGTITALGTDMELKEFVRVGDKIIFGKYAGQHFMPDMRNKILILRKDEIMGKIEMPQEGE